MNNNEKKLFNRYKIEYQNLPNLIEKNLKIGDKLTYKKTNERVELVKIHYDDIIPYYTIKMPNNREKQTTIDKLISIK